MVMDNTRNCHPSVIMLLEILASRAMIISGIPWAQQYIIISDAMTNTAVIIAICAGLLILLSILVLLILRLKGQQNQSDIVYVVRQSDSFHQSIGPNAALLTAAEIHDQHISGYECINKRHSQEFKEWFV